MFKMFLNHIGFAGDNSSMKKASYEVELVGKRQIAEKTYEFIFKKPKDFHFNAGQHIRITLLNPQETDTKGNSRFMTLANIPSEKDLVIAMRMTDSAFKRVINKMKIGEKVLIQILLHSPHGSFVIHKDASVPVVFLVGGIGIVPAYSMIKDAIERRMPHKIFLFYSNRRPKDTPYLHELRNLERRYPSFKLIATMTKPVKAWQGEKGYIDKKMLQNYIKDLQHPIYYIAGLSNMVKAMKALMKDIGVAEDHIRSEDFSGMKMGIIDMTSNRSNKTYLIYAVGIVIVFFVILAHVGIADLMYSALSIKNLSLLTIGLILLIIAVKVITVMKLKHHFYKPKK